MTTLSITGSRSFNDYDKFLTLLTQYLDNHNIYLSKIISGGAVGVDTMAKKYAKDSLLEFEEILPDWKNKGKKAGILRNMEIINKSDYNVVFWDGISKGSKFNIDYCSRFMKKCKVINI